MPYTEYDYSLTHLNTMALTCIAKQAITIVDKEQLSRLPKSRDYFILSGGSNVILPEYLDTTVLLPRFLGIKVLENDEKSITIEVAAGENWHELVTTCTHNGWYGLENLALIPGLVGAAPIQNIGAYGVSLEDVLVGVKIYRLSTGKFYYVNTKHCQFGYRDSVFKHTKDVLITSIHLKLHKDPSRFNASYGDVEKIAQDLADSDNDIITPVHIMQAVINIRKSRLPNPKELPNCGSFFQNPIISINQYERLKRSFPNLPHYPVNQTTVKVPAAWLIDKAGLKGGGVAPITTHKNQALILTNHAPNLATQKHIKMSQDFIVKTIRDIFGIALVREPVWVNEDGSTISLSQ